MLQECLDPLLSSPTQQLLLLSGCAALSLSMALQQLSPSTALLAAEIWLALQGCVLHVPSVSTLLMQLRGAEVFTCQTGLLALRVTTLCSLCAGGTWCIAAIQNVNTSSKEKSH